MICHCWREEMSVNCQEHPAANSQKFWWNRLGTPCLLEGRLFGPDILWLLLGRYVIFDQANEPGNRCTIVCHVRAYTPFNPAPRPCGLPFASNSPITASSSDA